MIGITENGDAGLRFDEVYEKASGLDEVILNTKTPIKLLQKDNLPRVKELNPTIHCNISGLATNVLGSVIEPGVYQSDFNLSIYEKLVEVFDKVYLRIDPIFLSNEALYIQAQVAERAITPVIINFNVDYSAVERRLSKKGIKHHNYIKHLLQRKIERNTAIQEIQSRTDQPVMELDAYLESLGETTELLSKKRDYKLLYLF